LPVLIPVIFGIIIIYAFVWLAPFLGGFIIDVLTNDLGIGTTLFNFLLIFAFVGSVATSTSTVANSQKMEYLLVMPLSMRTIFLEKSILIILYNSIIWLTLGTPIFIGLSYISPIPYAFLSIPVFIILLLVLISLGVSLGGLVGLAVSKLVAGRRTLKQIGYFAGTGIAILASALWYYSFYIESNFEIFSFIYDIAALLGLSSIGTPGYAVSATALALVVGAPIDTTPVLSALLFTGLAVVLLYLNSVISERAHYSGWLASDSTRTSKEEVEISHEPWCPQPIPGVKLSSTASVSMWYNITSVRREGRVFANYLMRPIQWIIWIIFPTVALGADFDFLLPYLVVAAFIPFATSYGLYFAGYETVYEGKNLMNLQLAAANMDDYVRGKIYSALPFTLGVGIVVSFIMIFVAPSIVIFLPALVMAVIFLCLASGAIAANAAASGGDFRANRMVLRQRGSAVQAPIRGLSILKASLLPNILGYLGVEAMLAVGLLFNPLYTYAVLPLLIVVYFLLFRRYSRSAGLTLAKIEAEEYL
jgi:hypothetical protein